MLDFMLCDGIATDHQNLDNNKDTLRHRTASLWERKPHPNLRNPWPADY